MHTPEECELSEPMLWQQVERMASRDWSVAGAASTILQRAGKAGVAAVLAGLADPRPRIRRACAEFLDHFGTDECVEALQQAAQNDAVPVVRRRAVHSLSCQRCKAEALPLDAVGLLLERAVNDSSISVRREAVAGLIMQPPDARAVPVLQVILRDETDRALRRYAHQALKQHDPDYRRQIAEAAKAQGIAAHQAAAQKQTT